MMPSTEEDSYFKLKYCRLCALELKCGVYIFGEEGKRLQIPEKIRKTMGILVLEEDTLPKKICTDCCSSLEDYAQYKDTVLDAQEKLASIAKNLEKSHELEMIVKKSPTPAASSSSSSSNNNGHHHHNHYQNLQQPSILKYSPSSRKIKSITNKTVLEYKGDEDDEQDDDIVDNGNDDQLDLSVTDVCSETSTPPPSTSSSCYNKKNHVSNNNNSRRDTSSVLSNNSNKSISIKCGYCPNTGEVFHEKQNVLTHILKFHPEIKHKLPKYRCSECPKTTDKYTTMRAHAHRHRLTGVQTFPTTNCSPKSYPNKSAVLDTHHLSKHCSTPSGKIFSCKDCGKRFDTRTGLASHSTTKHMEELPSRLIKDTDGNMSDSSFLPDGGGDDSMSMDESFTSTNNIVPERQRRVTINGETIEKPSHHHLHHHNNSNNNNIVNTTKGTCSKLPVFSMTSTTTTIAQVDEKDYDREMQQFRKISLPVPETSTNNSSSCSQPPQSQTNIESDKGTCSASIKKVNEWSRNSCDEASTSSTSGHHHHHHTNTNNNSSSTIKIRRYNCTDCDASYLEKLSLEDHTRIHHAETPTEVKCLTQLTKSHKDPSLSLEFQCSICNKSYKSRRCLRRHVQLHTTTNKKYICSICSKGFRVKSKLVEHENSHNNSRPLGCRFCDKSFNGHPNYVKHIRRKHPNEISQDGTTTKIPPPTKIDNFVSTSSMSKNLTRETTATVISTPSNTITSSSSTSAATLVVVNSTVSSSILTTVTPHALTTTTTVESTTINNHNHNNNNSSNPSNNISSNSVPILIPVPTPAHHSSNMEFQQSSTHNNNNNQSQHSHLQQSQLQQQHQQQTLQNNWHHNNTNNNNNTNSASSSGTHIPGKNYLNPSGGGSGNLSSSSAISMNAMDLVDCAIQNALVGNGQETSTNVPSNIHHHHHPHVNSTVTSTNNNHPHHHHHHHHNNNYDNNNSIQPQLQSEPMELSYKLESNGFQDMPMELTKVFQRDPLELCVRQQDLNQLMDLSSRVDTSGIVSMSMNMAGVNVHKIDLTERELMDLSGAFRQPIDLISRTDDSAHDLYNEGSLVDLSLRSNFGQDQSASSFLRELIDLSARSDSFHGELDLTKPNHHNHPHQTQHNSNNSNNNNTHLHHHSSSSSSSTNPNTIHNCHATTTTTSPPKNGTSGNNVISDSFTTSFFLTDNNDYKL